MQVMLKPQPSVDLDELLRKVDKAKSLLILDHPFFGMSVSKRPIIYTDPTVETAAMTATGQMYMNPTWCGTLPVKQLMFLLAHEALHYMLCHSLRLGARNHTAWNVACDKVINDTLIAANVGEPIPDGVYMRDARNYAAEELYDDNDGKDGPVGPIGNDVGPPTDVNGTILGEAEQHEIEAQAKIETVQSAEAAKAMGKLPSSIERIVDELVNVTTPWFQHLEVFMSSKIRDGKSWNMPNRKFISKNIYLKGKSNLPRMGEIVIGVDTSGSIGQAELNMFNAHVDRILDTCVPEKVTVVYCDSRVNHVDEFEPDDFPVRLTPHGGGGTSFKPVFDYIDDNHIDPEVVVYLTDGYGDQNNFTTSHETVWLTTGTTNFEWGTVIEFKE